MKAGYLSGNFAGFAENIIGNAQPFETPFGSRKILYADWTASGRCYGPIEGHIQNHILPYVGNTHSCATVTGTLMTEAYEQSKQIIKQQNSN